jgi:hypothetical protein
LFAVFIPSSLRFAAADRKIRFRSDQTDLPSEVIM